MKSFYHRMAALLPVFFFWVVALQAQSQAFNYTGAEQIFTVPAGVTMVHVTAFAATGGAGNSASFLSAGGRGGNVEADLAVTPGATLYIYVGGKGIQGGAGGFNGGGIGGSFNGGLLKSGGGGGASDIRIGGNALSNRVLVAGGGGGAGITSTGGAGGGLTGGNGGGGGGGGTGGTPTAGGSSGGALGLGGSAGLSTGGGGGYYGGGYNSLTGGGGGGSSYTDPTLCTNVVHTQAANDPDSHGSMELSWSTGPTYQPIVTQGGLACSAQATYNYDSDYDGKPSFSAFFGISVIRWEAADNQWHIRNFGNDVFQNGQNTTLPPCDGWVEGPDGCEGESISLAGGCGSSCITPSAYPLIGGGRSCDDGVSIVLVDYDLGVTYQLYKGIIPVGLPLEGTGGPTVDFGFINEVGIYTVVATNTVGGCTAEMTGSATITPCFIGPGTVFCSDDNIAYILTGSEAPSGNFSGPGVTDNGDGTATFNPPLAGNGGTVTYTINEESVSTSQNIAVYLCTAPPTFSGLDAEYCNLDESVTLTGSLAPFGFFTGPGITNNGDGTASFDPGAANLGENTVRYLYSNTNFNGAWVSMSAGSNYSMAIKTDGSLWAWGFNVFGQFGNGTNINSDIPVQIDAADDWASVSAGGTHTLATKTDGTLWAWGDNGFGALGNGSNYSNAPVQVGSDADWANVSAGRDHSMAIKTDGTIWTWGDNGFGALGNGSNINSNAPVQVGSDNDWISISAGDRHSLATKTDGTLWAWGQNVTGQLGDGSDIDRNAPVQVGTDTDWNKAAGGNLHTLATKTNGTLWAWGDNFYGQLGNGNNTASNTPIQVGTGADWAGIAACSTSVAIRTNGTLWAWGSNFFGQIGNGNNTNSNTPVQVGTDNNWVNADAGAGHTMGIRTNGMLWAWGFNFYGQIGNGVLGNANTPTNVVTAISEAFVTITQCPDFTGLAAEYCGSDEPVSLTGNYAPDGTFSGPGITDNGDGTASFDPGAAGTGGTIIYTIAPSNMTRISGGSSAVSSSKNVTVLPSPTVISSSNISAANCNNTTCTEDDTYTADITVTYSSLPASGTLDLSGSDIAGAAPSVNVEDLGATSHTFTGVTLRADGVDIELTAAFSGGCDYTDNNVDTAPTCSGESVYTLSVVNVFGNSEVAPVFTPDADLYNNAPQWSGEDFFGQTQRIRWDASNSRWEIVRLPQGTLLMSSIFGDTENLPCFSWEPSQNIFPNPIALLSGCGPLISSIGGPACDITDISIANATACNDNGTTDSNDDYFTADVTVTFAYAPEFQNLVLSQDGNELANKESSNDLLCTTTWTFTGVQMPANGQDVVLTAEFGNTDNRADQAAARTGNDCTFTSGVLMTAPASCSCVPTSAFMACPSTQSVNVDADKCFATVNYEPQANGTPAPSYEYAFTGASNGFGVGSTLLAEFNAGVTNLKITATNECGSVECNITVTVTDNQLPVVTCPANTTLGIGDNCSTPLASYGLATKSDNCSTAIFETQSPVAGTIVTGHNSAQTVTLTATDAGGNTASCSFVVTLKDVMAPSITCPANIIRPTDLNLCSAAVAYATPLYSDNCSGGGAAHINGGTSGSAFAKGTTTVNWQATDGVGLTKTCSFTITVTDGQAPTITCPANMVRSNDAGQCSASVAYPTPKASDNCSLATGQPQWISGGTTPTASGANSTATFQKGVNVVTWRATDAVGLTKTCTFRVTVNDKEAPTLTCPAPMSLTTEANTCSSVATTYTNPTFTDNCVLTNSTATRINGLVSGSTFPVGNSKIVFQATDAAGNTRRCTMVVTVTDNQPPVINCPASVVATGTGTPCVENVFYGSITASDNCAGTLTPFLVTGWASGSIFPAGVTINTFRAVAPNGQSSECSVSVTVDCGSGMGNNGVEVRNTNLSMQHSDKLELKLAPNPALSTVTVSLEGVGAGGGTLLVFDAVGRLVLRQVIAESQQTAVFQVDGAEFAPGIYRVNLRTASGMVTKTLVVVK